MKSKSLLFFLCSFITLHGSQSATLGGPLARVSKTFADVLQTLGAVTPEVTASLIDKYSSYTLSSGTNSTQIITDMKIGKFNTIIQDRAALSEAYFTHLGLSMGSSYAPPGVDGSAGVSVNIEPIFMAGLSDNAPEPIVSTMLLPDLCGTMHKMSRYIRGLSPLSLAGVTTAPKTFSTSVIDTFHGIFLINYGWLGLLTFQDAKITPSWYKVGIVMDSGSNKGFIAPGSFGYIKASGGVDQWSKTQEARTVYLNISDGDGGELVGQPTIIQLKQGTKPTDISVTVDNQAGGTTTISGDASTNLNSFLEKRGAAPWALLVSLQNPTGANNKADLKPQFIINGAISLNPIDYPLSYQAFVPPKQVFSIPLDSTSKGIFTSSALVYGVSNLRAEMAKTSTTLSTGGKITSSTQSQCPSISLSSPNDFTPIKTVWAKATAVENYNWGAQNSIKKALDGTANVLKNVFFRRDAFQAKGANYFLEQILGRTEDGSPFMADPNFVIL